MFQCKKNLTVGCANPNSKQDDTKAKATLGFGTSLELFPPPKLNYNTNSKYRRIALKPRSVMCKKLRW